MTAIFTAPTDGEHERVWACHLATELVNGEESWSHAGRVSFLLQSSGETQLLRLRSFAPTGWVRNERWASDMLLWRNSAGVFHFRRPEDKDYFLVLCASVWSRGIWPPEPIAAHGAEDGLPWNNR